MKDAIHILFTVALFALLHLGTGTKAVAQSDSIWSERWIRGYYQITNRNLQSADFFQRCDTLMREATRANNTYYQGMVFFMKSSHYYYKDDLEGLKNVHQEAWKYCKNRKDKNAIFYTWGRLINYYFLHSQNLIATRELFKSLQTAQAMNNAYGIVISYRSFGAIYASQGLYDKSIENYLHAADYARKHYISECMAIYLKILGVYDRMGDYAKIADYCEEIQPFAHSRSWRNEASVLGIWMDAAMRLNRWQKAGELYQRIEELTKGQYLGKAERSAYLQNYIVYHIHTKQFDLARKELDELMTLAPNEEKTLNRRLQFFDRTRQRDSLLKAINEKIAYLQQQPHTLDAKDPMKQIKNFNVIEIVGENRRLDLHNSQLQIEQLRAEQDLLRSQQRRNLLQLRNRELVLANSKAQAQQQNNLLKRQKREADNMQLEEQTNHQRQLWFYLLIGVLILIAGLYALMLRRARCILDEKELLALQAEEEAEQADKVKSRFLQNISHEIRTPLNAILGFNEVLNDETVELSPAERHDFIKRLNQNIQFLNGLVNDVLDLSKLESGTYQLALSQTPPASICEGIVYQMTDKVHKDVQLLFSNEMPADAMLYTDVTKVTQVIHNYVDNACKFTTSGHITVACCPGNDKQTPSVLFTVTDTGPGIPHEHRKFIFDSFTKLNSFEQGTGVGLNICLLVADLLHGHAWLDINYTDGARFCFEIPLNYAATPPVEEPQKPLVP